MRPQPQKLGVALSVAVIAAMPPSEAASFFTLASASIQDGAHHGRAYV